MKEHDSFGFIIFDAGPFRFRQGFCNMVNDYPQRKSKLLIRIINSLPALSTAEWQNIYTAVGRTNYYGQFIPQVVTLMLIKQLGGQDLYDGQNENGANYLVNMSSAIKQIDLEVWFYQTKHDNESLEVDLPIFCPYIGNFLENNATINRRK
ncbi:MAG: hypothetical protein EZS28_030543 [Streblomastix strix]|uniref:Uncharacterized protein n=1 Tax=Streblomastix strix TaxID=222440 RepID=A0A5J4UVN0_9EUKA|nr:MAG: hypothetical protein EZS28_030543 [Streblomastix strix]